MNDVHRSGSRLAILFALLLSLPAAALGASPGQEASSGQDAAPVQEAAPIMTAAAEAELDRALGGVEHDGFELASRVYFFPSLQGGTLAMVGFEMGNEGLMFGVYGDETAGAAAPTEVARLELFGAVLQDGAEVARFGDEFTVGRGAAGRTALKSFGSTLGAGSYELVWGVRDTIAETTASSRDTIEVPDLTMGGLGTSSVLMVTGAPMAAPGQFEPYTVYDGVRVLTVAFPDDLDRVLAGDLPSIMLTYIVAGAQFDPATQGFNLELSYRIVDAEDNALWQAEPQTLNRPTVGQEIPLASVEGLAAGNDYAFEILVKDLAAGTEATTRVPFQIAG